ncbi:protein IQ-DOMAIN 29-like isoform X2 [Mangifera indica]|uniref:protein IQ-DOMAIN 29-like isoform X2 n=1 Tax=Mangifera indica TaxID=29780 RepID=UPI001CFA758F|nr:protein IQ-DOMAIN 29-like isoform X2 [Mangifera indica]
MGKTPGKWIKTLFRGKKSSKSDFKGRDILKSANTGESLISSKVPVSDSLVAPLLISQPTLETGSRIGVDSKNGVAAELTDEGVNLLSAKGDGSLQTVIDLGSEKDPDRILHNQAATRAQSAFRGYRARRAFRTLKGIIRLQALIRGHLVRRQAISTLLCIQRIVKFQALARGQKVRRSDIGIEVQKICSQGVVLVDCSNSAVINTFTVAGKLSENAIIQKLLASSPSAMPLHLSYYPGEPNSTWQWLERWTKALFWQPHLQSKKNIQSKSQIKRGSSKTVETNSNVLKRNVRKSSLNTKNGSVRSTYESEKSKCNPRKVSTYPVDSVHEHPQNDFLKVKRNLRKNSSSTREATEQLEVDNEKRKLGPKKSSNAAVPDVPAHGNSDSFEKMINVSLSVSKHSDVDTALKLSEDDGPVDALPDHPAPDLQPTESNGKVENTQGTNDELNSKDHHISIKNQKNSQRRASLPAKIDHQENVLHSTPKVPIYMTPTESTPKVPSYMAPTESAKAKLRGQSSPRFSQDLVENNGIARRHSLPSSNGKPSSLSPRVTRLVQAAGKGVVRPDRSLTSSRDGGDKVIQAEWRR